MANPSFVHFYWSSVDNQKPPLAVGRNLACWSKHLRDTEFVPILWCNESAYNGIKGKGKVLTLEQITPHLPQKKSSLQTLRAELAEVSVEYWYCENDGVDLQAKQPGYPKQSYYRGVFIVNVEDYFKSQAQRIPIYNELLKFYCKVNLPYMFELIKDHAIYFFVPRFSGFYFDVDIKPSKIPFYQRIEHVNEKIFAHKFGQMYKSCMEKFISMFPLMIQHDISYEEEVGFYFCPFKIPSTDTPVTIKSTCSAGTMEAIAGFQTYIEQYKQLDKNPYLKIAAFPDPTSTCRYIEALRHDPKSLSKNLRFTYTGKFPPHLYYHDDRNLTYLFTLLSNFVRHLYGQKETFLEMLSSSKMTDDEFFFADYAQCFKFTLEPYFTTISPYEDSSLACNGYQLVKAQVNALEVVSKQPRIEKILAKR